MHLHVLKPAPHIYAFYDGRVAGYRFMAQSNWVDDGALSLGIASYAIVDGHEALVYDTHVSLDHARFIRRTLEEAGVTAITVVLSHWHLDHVAGNAVFADCPIISNVRTLAHLQQNQAGIEDGSYHGPPALAPLVLPSQTFDGRLLLKVGRIAVELITCNIHSDDATVAWLPDEGLLLAGDTVEDTVTYVDDPKAFPFHLQDLERLWELQPVRLLPNHGDPDIIALGGYEKTLIRATQQYIRMLQHCVRDTGLRGKGLADLIHGPLAAGWVNLYEPYEQIHRQNLERVLTAELS